LIKNIHGPDVDSEVWQKMYAKNERTKPCIRGSEGAEFVSELEVKESDIIVTKNRYDAFYGTNLETYLSANNISQVLIAGVQTNVCVDTTVRSASIRDYDVTVLQDCVGTPDRGRSKVIFENIEQYFGDLRESTDIELTEFN
jgi:ureidoacrylate peracid hydrolase